MKELQEQIIKWAKAKGIDNTTNQKLKVIEEAGEVAGAILKGNRDEVLMEIGDVAVTIIVLHYLTRGGTEFPSIPESYEGNKDDMVEDLVYAVHMADVNPRCLTYVQYVAHHFDSTLEECLTMAWNKIKDRQGKTVNGTFIKNE